MRSTCWIVVLCGCTPHPRVAFAPYDLPPPSPAATERATAGLLHDLERGHLVELTHRGRTLTNDDVADLPPEVLVATYSVTAAPRGLQHLDLWGPTADDLRRPITITVDRRVVDVDFDSPVPNRVDGPTASTATRELVATRFGLRGVTHGEREWSSGALDDLVDALSALEPEALQALAGVELRRMAVSPRAAGRELAWFDPRTEPPRIDVYDLAFEGGAAAIGPVADLLDLSVMTLVHEMAHALADWPLRVAWVASRTAEPEDREAAQKQVRRLGSTGPVIDAWRQVRDGPGPTDYGARRRHESFAEAYALSRLDPEALAAVMPRAAAWFASGGHLNAAGLAAPRSGG